ncbi:MULTISPECIES: heavy-metal-associated domain-containing protein [Microvirga]|uniref:Copper chaperone n=2 Tax=Microvirga TaxID=186650 RepID=A0ABW9Z2Q2_9HYPH|nr:heavy metal-associated domain-containing protein [Microvirga arsenatis]NBJ13076.1 copper chaperone [Microvirga arsenatis]NBJ26805.1 copper chaperone [Microvirga arsenatis]
MRTDKVTGMPCGGCETAVTRAIKRQLGEGSRSRWTQARGEVRISASADPQIVAFAIEGAGYVVESVYN